MLKIVERPKGSGVEKRVRDIPYGTVFAGDIRNPDSAGPYLRAFHCIIDLRKPESTWTAPDLVVDDYQELSATLTVEPA